MPLTTVFATVKLGLFSVARKPSVLSAEFRVAASISTSEGEFTRVGTFGVCAVFESLGKILVDLDFDLVMLETGFLWGSTRG
jgi:hypothetical protein